MFIYNRNAVGGAVSAPYIIERATALGAVFTLTRDGRLRFDHLPRTNEGLALLADMRACKNEVLAHLSAQARGERLRSTPNDAENLFTAPPTSAKDEPFPLFLLIRGAPQTWPELRREPMRRAGYLGGWISPSAYWCHRARSELGRWCALGGEDQPAMPILVDPSHPVVVVTTMSLIDTNPDQ